MVTREDSACSPTALPAAKVCRRCETAKPLTAFYRYPDKRASHRKTARRQRSRVTDDGHRAVCKACWRTLPSRSKDARRAEREAEAALSGRVCLTRDEIRQVARERVRAEKTRHAPTIASQRRVLRQLIGLLFRDRCAAEGRNADAVQYQHRYRTDAAFRDREIARTWKRKAASGVMRTDGRTTRAVHDDGTLPGSVIQALFAEAVDCPYCRKPMDPREKTLDHVMPVSRGGAHSITNVAVCCRQCNTVKRARTPEEMGWTNPLTTKSEQTS